MLRYCHNTQVLAIFYSHLNYSCSHTYIEPPEFYDKRGATEPRQMRRSKGD